MQNKDNQSKRIYLKATRQWVDVSEEYYRDHTRYHDALRKRQQSHGQCVCPKNKFWLCDKNHYRNGDNFIGSDCLPVDCDNDHSEEPADWITPDDVAAAFPGVSFAVHYSRFHNREKNGKPARPKFHILFPIDFMTDAADYSDMKRLVNTIFPYFDTQALDAARFFFGTTTADVEIREGNMNLTDFLQDAPETAARRKKRAFTSTALPGIPSTG